MKINLDVDVHHLARVEGHGNIQVRVNNGTLQEARWDVVETPRFFEAMLVGKPYVSVSPLVSRICGICSVSHALVSLLATEAAFGVQVPAAARWLRLLAKHGETLQSHTLHLFFLAAPDFLGLDDVLPLLEQKPEVVRIARRLKGLGNRVCELVAGRTTHPVSLQVGGVVKMPSEAQLRHLRHDLQTSLDELQATAELWAGLSTPDFARPTEYVSLAAEPEQAGAEAEPAGRAYPFLGRTVVSSDGVRRPVEEYLSLTNEEVTPHNTSKWCHLSREALAVGALARYNNNAAGLLPEARAAAEALGLQPGCANPFMNNQAQIVECVQVVHESLALLDALLALPPGAPLRAEVSPRAGSGVAAVEAPRGILYHAYHYDEAGRVTAADCVIPTTQNNKNIHLDLAELVRQQARAGVTDKALEQICSTLVRAYDPCISCSVH